MKYCLAAADVWVEKRAPWKTAVRSGANMHSPSLDRTASAKPRLSFLPTFDYPSCSSPALVQAPPLKVTLNFTKT